MKHLTLSLLAALLAPAASAHPHIYIDTGLEVIFDDSGALTHIRVTWQYDELYSLLVTEDMGLDPDFDGELTTAEQARLTGFDMNWVAGFNGDLEAADGAQPLPLSGPIEPTATFADGRITTTHLRRVMTPVDFSEPVVIKPYDPTYYTAYDVTLPIVITGSDACRSRVKMPDITAGLSALRDQLSGLDANADPGDAGLPNIGGALASEVIVICAES